MNIEKKLMDALTCGKRKQIENIFEKIYNQYYKLVYFCIRKYIDKKEDVEELSNDVFVHFFNNLSPSKSIENIKYYLTQSAKNTAINKLRKNKIEVVEYDDSLAFYELNSDNQDLLGTIKKSVTTEEFELVVRHLFLDEKLKDIAKEKGVNSNSYKSKYRRLLTKLKKILGDSFYEK